MNDLIVKEKTKIENMIYDVRGKQVMLASDVARLYNSETKKINQVVKRNIDRFPEEFCFRLNYDEYLEIEEQMILKGNCSRSQIVTLNKSNNYRGSNLKYLPYVFTEHGVMMLSGLLKNDVASKVNVSIIRAFVEMRKYISSNFIKQEYINHQVLKNTEDIKLLQESLDKMNKNNINALGLFFEGQIYDSYSLLLDIFNTSKENIIIIDNYIDKSILDVLRKVDKKVTIITNKYNNNDYTKYKEQYKNIALILNNKIHDRFIIIDKNVLYHCGSSLKDLGKRCFAINKIENKEWLNKILSYVCK